METEKESKIIRDIEVVKKKKCPQKCVTLTKKLQEAKKEKSKREAENVCIEAIKKRKREGV